MWRKAGTKDLPMPPARLPSHTKLTRCTANVPTHGSMLKCRNRRGGLEKKECMATFDTNLSHPGLLLIYPKTRDSYHSQCSKERKMAKTILFSIKYNSFLPKNAIQGT